jgi:hypothetical protein
MHVGQLAGKTSDVAGMAMRVHQPTRHGRRAPNGMGQGAHLRLKILRIRLRIRTSALTLVNIYA